MVKKAWAVIDDKYFGVESRNSREIHVIVYEPKVSTTQSLSKGRMVYIPPPHLAIPTRPSYAETYAHILATHRRSPLISASSVIILVAADVDALCAARMLAELFKQDDVMYRIIPVSGEANLEKKRQELLNYTEVSGLVFVVRGRRWYHIQSFTQ